MAKKENAQAEANEKVTEKKIVLPDYDKATPSKVQTVSVPNVPALLEDVRNSAVVLNEVVNQLIAPYTKALDKLLDEIDVDVMSRKKLVSTDTIEYFILNLPIVIYYAVEGVEELGVQDDVSKAIREEKYHYAFSNALGTIPDKTAFANGEVQEHTLINITYQRAYKKLKQRIEAANEVLSSLKKVLTKRLLEMEMTVRGD